jgi:hypothetical protein
MLLDHKTHARTYAFLYTFVYDNEIACTADVDVGPFFIIQPNPSFRPPNPTQSIRMSSFDFDRQFDATQLNPTHPKSEIWDPIQPMGYPNPCPWPGANSVSIDHFSISSSSQLFHGYIAIHWPQRRIPRRHASSISLRVCVHVSASYQRSEKVQQ